MDRAVEGVLRDLEGSGRTDQCLLSYLASLFYMLRIGSYGIYVANEERM